MIATSTAQPVAGTFKRLNVANYAAGAPDSQMLIQADELVVENTSGLTQRLSSVSQGVETGVSGAGGIDTGVVAQGTGYYVWVIYNTTTASAAGLFSLSSTSPTMPSGYTFKARVAWNYVENAVAKRLNRIQCYGRRCT